MQLLKIPYHYNDMTASISLTGMTLLKSTKYRQRHAGSGEIVQKPVEGLILAKNDVLEIERLSKRKKSPQRKKVIATDEPKKVKKPAVYTINKKEVSHRIRNYINQMPGEKQLYFWTITFPVNTSDNTAFILLNKWLTRLRKEKLLKQYLWVTERQQNGTIHFHIAINNRVCVKKANRYMRACIFTSIDKGEIEYSRIEAVKYNGVDISKNRKTRRVTNFAKKKNEKALINYIVKYVSKSTEGFTHLAWHSSREYSNLIISVRFTVSELQNSNVRSFLDEKPMYENEWCYFYKWKSGTPKEVVSYLSFVNHLALSLLN